MTQLASYLGRPAPALPRRSPLIFTSTAGTSLPATTIATNTIYNITTAGGTTPTIAANLITTSNTVLTQTNGAMVQMVNTQGIWLDTTYLTTTGLGAFDCSSNPITVILAAQGAGEITALETHLLLRYAALTDHVKEKMIEGFALTSEYLALIVEEELLTMPDDELYPLVLDAAIHLDDGLQGLEKKVQTKLRQKIQADLHHPAHTVAYNSNGFFYEPDRAQWNELCIESEDEVGEDQVRELLNRQFLPVVMRWRRDMGYFTRARLWLDTPQGQRWRVEKADWEAQMTRQMRREEQRRLDGLAIMQAAAQKLERQKERERQAKTDFAKGSIKKATKLFDRMGQTSKLTMFVSNQEVELSSVNSKFKFVVRSSGGPGWLFDRTQVGRNHTPYELMVLTKDDVYLTKLCVYFRDMPVLDQLLALSVLIDAGDEIRLLEKGNWFGHRESWTREKTEAIAAAYPQLLPRCPTPVQVTKPQVGVPERARIINHQQLSDDHWEPFEGRVHSWIRTWMEPVRQPLSLLHH